MSFIAHRKAPGGLAAAPERSVTRLDRAVSISVAAALILLAGGIGGFAVRAPQIGMGLMIGAIVAAVIAVQSQMLSLRRAMAVLHAATAVHPPLGTRSRCCWQPSPLGRRSRI